MSKSLLSKKSSLTSRRNIIVYIIATILILSVVAGFTNIFHTDNRKFSAGWGETIVMEAKPPANGTPSDYDLLSNLEFTAYKIHHSKYFRGETDGKVSADIGISKYTQTLTNTRVVYDKNTVFTETISSSSMKSVAEQKYADHGIIIYRGADKISGNKVTYSSTAQQMSYEDYSKKYGSVPNQLSKYIINKDTILAVKDENAVSQKALNGTGNDDDISFEVPDRLVPNADGNYVFTLTLDPTASSLYYRNEVRTLGGADSNPKFYSVQITITINSDWVPISTRTLENYDIEIPVLGPMNCSGNNFEVFTMVDDENGVIPEKDFFQPYVDKAKEDPNYVPPDIDVSGPPSPSDYLASAFADYLSGSKNLDLKADIAIGDFKARDLKLSLNLNTLDVQAMLGSGLYVKYAGDKIYIKNNDINGYISTADIDKLTNDPALKGLLGGMSLDLEAIFGGDMLDVIFKDCEMTTENGVTTIPMSFALDLSGVIESLDSVQINAAININDSDKSLKSITGTVTIGDTAVDINVQPLNKAPSFPSVNGAVDLSGILDFVPNIASTAMQNTYGIDGTLTLNDMTVGVSAYVDRTNGLKAEALLNVLGLDVKVTYVDDVIYAEALGATVRGTIDELPDLLNVLLDLTDFSKYQNQLKLILPTSVNDVVKMLKSIDVNGNTLGVGMEFIGIPIDVKLTRGEGKLQSVALDVDVNLFNIKAKVNADLKLSEPTVREVKAPLAESYLTFTDLAELITQVKPYLSADYYTAAINGYVEINGTRNDIGGSFDIDKSVTGVAARGTLAAFGQSIAVTYVDDEAYIAFGDIKVKLNVADIDSFIPSVMRIVNQITGADGLPEIDASVLDGAVKSAEMTDGTLSLVLSVEGWDITVLLNLDTGKIEITAAANGMTAKLNVAVCTAEQSHNITKPTGAYMDAAELAPMLDTAADVLTAGGVKAIANVTIGDMELAAAIECTIENGELKVLVKEDTLGLTVKLLGDTAYIEVGGVKVSGQLADIIELIDSVIPNLPDNIRPYVEKINEQIMGIIPSGDEFSTDGKADIAKIIDTVYNMLTDLSLSDGVLTVGISRNALSATLNISTDLSDVNGNIALTFDGIGGPFGDHYAMEFGIGVSGIIASPVTVEPVVAQEYVKASTIIDALQCVLPLVKEKAFALNVNATVFDQTVSGEVYIDLGDYTLDSISAKAVLDIAGANVIVTVINKTLYLDIKSEDNTAIKISQPLNKDALSELIEQLEKELPDLGIADKIGTLKDITTTDVAISDILNKITLSPIDNGMALEVALNKATVKVDILLTDGKHISAINANCDLDGKTVTVALNVTTDENGVLSRIQTTEMNVMGTELGLDLQIAPAPQNAVTVDGDYLSAVDILPYIDPIMTLVNDATAAKSMTLTISDMTIEVMGKEIDVTGTVDISFNPVAVRAALTLFAGTDDEVVLYVVFTDNVLYVNIGKISLKFDITNDMGTLSAAIEPYLPKSIKNLKDLSALTTIMALFNNITSIAEADGIEEIMSIMFSQDNAYGKSMIRQIVDMLRLGSFNDLLTASITVMDVPLTVTVDVSPVLDNSGELGSVRLGAKVSNMLSVSLSAGLDFSDEALSIPNPEKTTNETGEEVIIANYTPIVDFITAVVNAVNTLTAKAEDKVTDEKDADGNLTGNKITVSQLAFEIDSFMFDYDMFKIQTTVDADGNTVEVKDEAGRPAIATDGNGNKIKDKVVKAYNKDGQDALRFGLTTTTVKDANGKQISKSTELAIEAHLKIEITDGNLVANTGFPIELDLYVKPTEDHPDGLAYLFYKEANGYGEKISIDYNSVLQLVAAVLDILNVKNDIVDDMLEDYKLSIDKTVFASMDIAGLSDISSMLNNLMSAVGKGMQAFTDIAEAWDRLQNAEDIDALIKEMLNDEVDEEATIKALLNSAISYIEEAIALFGSEDKKADEIDKEPETNKLNGALVGKVVNSVYFNSANSVLSAYVDNAVATGTEGWATVSVASNGDKINSIGVDNLDVNTAKLNEFDLQFTPITNAITVTIPDDWQTQDNSKDSYKVMYSDFANIKHLLFDVMNTANMLEFDIGGGTNDKINLSVLGIVEVDIKYSAKVRIIDQGEGADPRYKTAADIQLDIPETVKLAIPVLPKCTTRLFFYDNVLYMHGVESWERTYNWKKVRYDWTINEKDYKFTVQELMDIMDEKDADGNKIGIDKLFKKFVFRLLPLAESALGFDIHKEIIDAVKNPPEAEASLKTIAQIFKKYTYTTNESGKGVHELVIGLKELALNGSLRDATVKLTGANDTDSNIYDNYIEHAYLETSFGTASMTIATIKLDATLTNTSVVTHTYSYADEDPNKALPDGSGVLTYYFTDKELTDPSPDNAPTDYYYVTRNELESTGMRQTVIDGVGYSFGKTCCDNSSPVSLLTYLDNTAWNAMDW